MSGLITIHVQRFDPERETELALEAYQVPKEEDATVMGALLHIYERSDGNLAFRCGCRNQYCGLCAMDIDGKPRLACTTRLKNGMVIRPLQKLPVSRDLLVDRRWIMPFLTRFELHVPQTDAASWPHRYQVPERHSRLIACTECLSCLAACPSYEHGRDDLGGPYHFVKLAQLHNDPRNALDRRAQAKALDIARCAECRRCHCPIAIPIYRDAIRPLLAK